MVTTDKIIDNLAEGASPLQRMQDLEAQVETPQVTTFVKKRNMAGTSKGMKMKTISWKSKRTSNCIRK